MTTPLHLATDGSYSPASRNAAWAWVDAGGRTGTGGVPAHLRTSPLTAELCAIAEALDALDARTPAVIHIDSKDALRVLRGTKPPAAEHRKLVARIRSALDARQPGARAALVYVKGHQGHRLNTAADRLCVATRVAADHGSEAGYATMRTVHADVAAALAA